MRRDIAKSSLTSAVQADESVESFMATIFELQKEDGGRMRIREFDAALAKIQSAKSMRSFDFPHFNEQVRPFGILNVDCDGIVPLDVPVADQRVPR
jgi:hypothetical protein